MTTETSGAVSVPTKLRSINVLAPELASKLAEQGITDSSTLLERGAMPEERDALAAATGIDPIQLLRAIYLIDLERVDGVAWSSAALLIAAGVTTVPDLAFRSAEDLLPQLQRANAEQPLVKRLPSLKTVKGWIEHARGLPQVVFFGGNGEVY